MHKVVVERPRAGGGRNKSHRRANLDLDLLPRSEGIRRSYRDRKRFTDVLGPLRRWLQSQVGRPWDDVYSEACAVIRPDSVVRAHIKTHLFEMVERHTFLKGGEVWCFAPRWVSPVERPVRETRSHRRPFYVHPKTGVLVAAKPPWHRARLWRDSDLAARRAREAKCRWLSASRALVRVQGLWFDCVMQAFPARFARGDQPRRFDLNARQMLSRAEVEARYGRPAVCVAKRQLSRGELRERGLSNSAEFPTPGEDDSER